MYLPIALSLSTALLVVANPYVTAHRRHHARIASDRRQAISVSGTLQPLLNPPVSTGTKSVFAHFMIGNAYGYTQDMFTADVQLASSKGLDAFALNVGTDSWEPDRVSAAYAAANQSGTDFQMFLSLDMSIQPCASPSDADNLYNTFIGPYIGHPSQFVYQGKPLVSTFAGESCEFGMGSVEAGWTYFTSKTSMFFLPAFNTDPAKAAANSALDGLFSWDSGWAYQPTNEAVLDSAVLSVLGGKAYMAAVSPVFFTHYSPESYNKNWLYPSDGFWFANRWAQIVAQRDSIDLVEVVTWNDYGESSYVGPLTGAQPPGTTWATGFDHTAFLDIASFYISAFKSGQVSQIAHDAVFLWSRSHPKDASAPDPIGRPTYADTAEDDISCLVLATAAGTLQLSAGSSSQTFSVAPGVNQFVLPMVPGSGMSADLSRNGQSIATVDGGNFTVVASPSLYNYNVYVVGTS